MQKSVWTIGQRKFSRLDAGPQHRLLARLAREALNDLERGDGDAWISFRRRYLELQGWAELDRYRPPAWLEPVESLEEYCNFHTLLGATEKSEAPQDADNPPCSWQPRFPVAVALDQVRSPHNVGSVLRLIDNFGLEGLVHASPWLSLEHPQLQRAAMGCQRWIPVRCEEDLPGYLCRADCPVVGIESDPGAVPLDRWNPPGAAVLVLGNESYGLGRAVRECCAEIVSIPMQGFKRSMNVTHALALVAWLMVAASGVQGGEDLG